MRCPGVISPLSPTGCPLPATSMQLQTLEKSSQLREQSGKLLTHSQTWNRKMKGMFRNCLLATVRVILGVGSLASWFMWWYMVYTGSIQEHRSKTFTFNTFFWNCSVGRPSLHPTPRATLPICCEPLGIERLTPDPQLSSNEERQTTGAELLSLLLLWSHEEEAALALANPCEVLSDSQVEKQENKTCGLI